MASLRFDTSSALFAALTWPRSRLLIVCLLVGGCDPAQTPDLHVGGTLMLAECGYSVATPDGASRPSRGGSARGASPQPRFLHLDVAAEPARNLAVLWRTDLATTLTTVEYGTSALDKKATGITFVYDTGDTQERVHETHLCGLQPDTEYRYRVGGDGAWSPEYRFRTAPDRAAAPDAEVTLLVLGDSRGGYSKWGQALDVAFGLERPDFILFSGDMVTLGPIQDEWDQWLAAGADELPTTALIAAHGNHEVNGVNFLAQFAFPGDERNFVVDIGPIHLTVANDTPPDAALLATSIAPTLDANLAKGAGAPWRVLMNHKTMFSTAMSRHPEDIATVRAAFQPLVDKHRIDLVLNGHDHDYERTKPVTGTTVGAGAVYLRSGSVGAPLDPSGSDMFTAFSESVESFVILHARVGRIEGTAYRLDGSVLDRFTLTK
jgi:hypothetical protein